MTRFLAAFLCSSLCALSACGPGELPEFIDAESKSITPDPLFLGDPANNAVYAVDVSHWEGVLAQREVDCFWESGVRHLIAGTQVEEVTRQQLDMAISRGMTVDAYVYIYWDMDIAAQVNEALRRAAGFPIGRLWIDVEEDPQGRGTKEIVSMVRLAVNTCRAQKKTSCGIYTGPGFWKTYMDNTTELADVPLWYAWYNYRRSLSIWSDEKFGGWKAPAGKQYAEEVLCSCGVDKNVMQPLTRPSVIIDRTPIPFDNKLPKAPTRLYPAHGGVVGVKTVKLMTATVPHATRYQLALEHFSYGKKFLPYYTWTTKEPFRKTYPNVKNSLYRFRARAKNSLGYGPWSDWVVFDYGKYTGPRPAASPTPPAPTPPAPTPPAPPAPTPPAPTPPAPTPVAGAPKNLAQELLPPRATLTCDAMSAVKRYEFYIEVFASTGSFAPYVSYKVYSPRKVFYPQIRNRQYRWRARAELNGVWGPWSNFTTFDFK